MAHLKCSALVKVFQTVSLLFSGVRGCLLCDLFERFSFTMKAASVSESLGITLPPFPPLSLPPF